MKTKKLNEAKYRVDIEGVETDSATDMARLLQLAGVTDQKSSVPSVQKSISPSVATIPDFDFGPSPDVSELTEAPASVTHATEQEFSSPEEAIEYWRDEFQKAFSDDYESIEGAMSVQLEDMGYDQFEIERMVDQAMQGLTETVDYSEMLESVFADRDVCDRDGLREVFGTDEVSDSEIIRAYTLNSEETDSEEALVRTADELGITGEQVQKALENAGFDVLTESSEIRCPECGVRHGKPQERAKEFSCSDCGTKIENPKGYDLEESVRSIYAKEAESDYELGESVYKEGKLIQYISEMNDPEEDEDSFWDAERGEFVFGDAAINAERRAEDRMISDMNEEDGSWEDLGLSEGRGRDEERVWRSGDRVVIKDARKYDTMSPTAEVEGRVIFVWDDGRVAVEVGNGQSNVDPEDLVLQEGETWDAIKKSADRMWNGTPEENKAELNTREKYAKENGLKGEPRIVQKFNEAKNPWTSGEREEGEEWTSKDEVELMDRLDMFLRKDSMAKAAMEDLQDPNLPMEDKRDIFRDLVSDMTGTANSIIDDMYPAKPTEEDIRVIVRSVLRAWKIKPLV